MCHHSGHLLAYCRGAFVQGTLHPICVLIPSRLLLIGTEAMYPKGGVALESFVVWGGGEREREREMCHKLSALNCKS